MRTAENTEVCDQCGAEGDLPGAENIGRHVSRYCPTCWAKRSNWDEGARSLALIMLGKAVAQAVSFGAPPSAIRGALEHALSDPEGLHKDDAFSLGAETVAVVESPVTVTLTPEMAECVAKLWREALEVNEPTSGGLHTPECLEFARGAINATVDRINLIRWGERRQDARLTLGREEMIQLAEDLMEGGADMVGNGRGVSDTDDPLARAQARRAYGRDVAAGMAILDQVASATEEA